MNNYINSILSLTAVACKYNMYSLLFNLYILKFIYTVSNHIITTMECIEY